MSGILQLVNTFPSGGFAVKNSLRFRSSASAYLNRTPTSAGNRQTWTWSCWVKRGTLSVYRSIFGGYSGTSNGSLRTAIVFNSSDQIEIGGDQMQVAGDFQIVTNAVYRDPSAWYHIVVAFDSTQATTSNRIKLYVNGLQITSFATSNYPTQNYQSGVNATSNQYLARYYDSGAPTNTYFDGYMAEINFIDGQALTPSSFGAFDATSGVWQPVKYSGTYGTNGFYLKFTDTTSTTTLCYDYSGNGNNWTPNNISLTSGSTYDSMLDSPTNYDNGGNGVGNYAVLNPLQTGSYVTESNANLTITGNTATNSALALSSIANLTSGKWYWEYTQGTVNAETCGVMTTNMAGISLLNGEGTTNSYGVGARANGDVYGAEKTVSTITSWTTGDVIGLALDCDNGAIYWSKNGSWLNSGVPTSGASKTGAVGVWTPSSTKVITPSFGAYNGGSVSATFGQRPFAYTPPTGFKALNTQNLPAASIVNGASFMAATLYTGNGTSQAVTNTVNGVSFQPDFVWIKSRSNAYSHKLYDSIRGVYKELNSDSTSAESTDTNQLTAFNSNGWSVGSGLGSNGNGSTFVGWQWKANGTAVTNNAGSITSQVSANTTAGFSVVTWTAPASGTSTVGHGLGVAPSFFIIKNRPQVDNWQTWHSALGGTQYLTLNTTNAVATNANVFSSAPTSTVLNFGTNITGTNYVAYCFAAIAGYSAFGSYTGNGSADGPFVFLGFRPRYVMIKRTDAAQNWSIVDTSRDTYNVANKRLFANLSDAEDTGIPNFLDILSNGFKCRDSNVSYNASGGTYIYAAFAENPLKFSLAR